MKHAFQQALHLANMKNSKPGLTPGRYNGHSACYLVSVLFRITSAILAGMLAPQKKQHLYHSLHAGKIPLLKS